MAEPALSIREAMEAMKWAILVALLAAAACAAPTRYNPNGSIVYDLNKAPEYFVQFVRDYHRVYKSLEDVLIHYEAFKKTLKESNDLNAKSMDATFGINNFADYTEEEFKAINGLRL